MTTVAVLTATGRSTVTSYLNAGTPSQPKFIGWGVGAATATSHDIMLFKEAPEARPSGGSAPVASVVTTTTINDTYQLVGTITAGTGETITEVMIVDSATKPTGATTWATAPTGTAQSGGTSDPSRSGTLTSGTGFASGVFAQDQSGEVMQFVTVSGTGVTGILRAQNGSTGVSSAIGNAITVGAIPGATVSGGTGFMHASFSGLPLSTGDSIQFTLQTQFQ